MVILLDKLSNKLSSQIKSTSNKSSKVPILLMVRPRGIEPPHPAPEAGALSTELRAHNYCIAIIAEYYRQVKNYL